MSDLIWNVFGFVDEAEASVWLEKARAADLLTLSMDRMPAAMVRRASQETADFIEEHAL